MELPIKIDLRNITNEMFQQAKLNKRGGSYCGPCLIGMLMTEEERGYCDGETYAQSIESLIDLGLVEVPAGQRELAMDLQAAYDCYSLGMNDTHLNATWHDVIHLEPVLKAA